MFPVGLIKTAANELSRAIATSLLILAATPTCPTCPGTPELGQLVRVFEARCGAEVAIGAGTAVLLIICTFCLGAAAGHFATVALGPGRAAPRKGACLPAAGG